MTIFRYFKFILLFKSFGLKGTVFLQIEREKADLSVQVIQLVERLEEAEGGAESQVRLLSL
jgi:predicted TIM-barrel fold metal-dependent hydrolase